MNAAILPDRARTAARDVAFFLKQGCTWERAHVLALFESEADDVLYATLQREATPTAPDGTNAYACQIRLSKNPDRVVARSVVRAETLRDPSVRLALAKLYMDAFLALMDEEKGVVLGKKLVERMVDVDPVSGTNLRAAVRTFIDTIEPFSSDDLAAALKTGAWYDRTALEPWQAEVIARALRWRTICGEET